MAIPVYATVQETYSYRVGEQDKNDVVNEKATDQFKSFDIGFLAGFTPVISISPVHSERWIGYSHNTNQLMVLNGSFPWFGTTFGYSFGK